MKPADLTDWEVTQQSFVGNVVCKSSLSVSCNFETALHYYSGAFGKK